jgi:putative transposase
MRGPWLKMYLHLVWATWDRLPILTEEIEARLYRAIEKTCLEYRCQPLAVGGTADHIHLFVRLSSVTSVAELTRAIKGSSSHLVTQELRRGQFFRWQGGYGAFTVSERGVTAVVRYVSEQKRHHAAKTLWDTLEQTEAEL